MMAQRVGHQAIYLSGGGVAAELGEQRAMRNHRLGHVEASDRARRALADPVFSLEEPNRTPELFRDLAGRDADDARMPIAAKKQHGIIQVRARDDARLAMAAEGLLALCAASLAILSATEGPLWAIYATLVASGVGVGPSKLMPFL